MNTRFFRSVNKLACLNDIRKFLAHGCKDASIKADLARCFDEDDATALLLNDRLFNVPPEVSAPLFALLLDEIKRGRVDDELTADGRKALSNSSYIVCTRVWIDPSQTVSALFRPLAAGSASKPKKAKTGVEIPFACLRPEDEHLWQRSEWAFAFGEANRVQKKGDPVPVRLCMKVSHATLEQAGAKLFDVYGKPEIA